MLTREQFYKSKKWESFRKVIIEQRTDADGFVHCCECGKPIVNKYDLIIHHKKELSEANVNDAMIALNPDNVDCLCFKCHNKVHDRWQGGNSSSGWKKPERHVYIVYGAPCAGKSSWVHDNATQSDLVVDLDDIWQMISINDRYVKPNALKSVVFEVRDKMYDIIKHRSGNWHSAFVITGGALVGDRERLKQRIGATDLVYIDTPKDECLRRLMTRQHDSDQLVLWSDLIDEWFERFQEDTTSPSQ